MKTDEELIDNFMGYEWIMVGYFGDPKTETEWQRKNEEWMEANGIDSIGRYSVNVADNLWRTLGDVNYKEWNQIMPVVEKFNMIDPSIFNYNAVAMSGLRQQQEILQALSIVTPIHIVHRYLINAIKWYNQQPK